MPNWRAVAFGVIVEGLLAFTGVLLPIFGHAMLGFGGGFVAGALAGGGSRSGAEHGALTGVASAVLVTLLNVVIAATVGMGSPIATLLAEINPVFETIFAVPPWLAVTVGITTLVVMSFLGGTVGGWLRGEKPLPALPPDQRGRNRP